MSNPRPKNCGCCTMLLVFRHLMKNDDGEFTRKYTIVSAIVASLIVLASYAIKHGITSVHASGMGALPSVPVESIAGHNKTPASKSSRRHEASWLAAR